MGFLIYNNSRPVTVDDRVLAHLQIVIVDRLRRGEGFSLNREDTCELDRRLGS